MVVTFLALDHQPNQRPGRSHSTYTNRVCTSAPIGPLSFSRADHSYIPTCRGVWHVFVDCHEGWCHGVSRDGGATWCAVITNPCFHRHHNHTGKCLHLHPHIHPHPTIQPHTQTSSTHIRNHNLLDFSLSQTHSQHAHAHTHNPQQPTKHARTHTTSTPTRTHARAHIGPRRRRSDMVESAPARGRCCPTEPQLAFTALAGRGARP